MTANDKYSYRKRGSLTQHIQMHFSWKQKGFSQLFCAFFKTALNFENLKKKDDPHTLCISKTTDSERRG